MKKQARSKGNKQSFKEKPDNLYWKKDKQWYLWFQDHEDETFKKLPGYRGLYFVSNYGKVISFHLPNPREMQPHIVHNSLTVNLSIDRKNKTYPVQKLVFLCFYGPLPRGIDVGHINGDTRDNHVKNLGLRVRPQEKNLGPDADMERLASYPVVPTQGPGCREVLQFSVEGRFIKEYPSIKEAARAVNSSIPLIVHTIRGDKGQRTSRGFQWFYKSDPRFKDGIKPVPPVKTPTVEVLQFSLQGKFLRSFKTIKEACAATKISYGAIAGNIKGLTPHTGGYQFRTRTDPAFASGIRDIPPVPPKPPGGAGGVKVVRFDLQGRFVAEYPSISHAAAAVETSSPAHISKCLKGKGKTAGGSQWRRRDDPRFKNGITGIGPVSASAVRSKRGPREEILRFDANGTLLHRYPDRRAAARAAGRSTTSINGAVNGKIKLCAGHQWRSSLDPRFKEGIENIPPIHTPRKRSRPVVKFNREGEKIAEYESFKAACRAEGLSRWTLLQYLKGRVPMTSEFYWEYKVNHPKQWGPPWLIPPPPPPPHPGVLEILQFDLKGRFLKSYASLSDAARATGASVAGIAGCARKRYHASSGYLWRYRHDPLFKKGVRDLLPSEITIRKTGFLLFSLEGKYLRTFTNKKKAAQALKISVRTIDRYARGKTRSVGGYQVRLTSDPMFRDGIVDIPPVEPEPEVHPRAKKVLQFDLHGRFIREYPSLTGAAEANKCTPSQILSNIVGTYHTAGGYLWRYRDAPRFKDGIADIEPIYEKRAVLPPNTPVLQFDLQGKFVRRHPNLKSAAKAVGRSQGGIQSCLDKRNLTCAGFQWRHFIDPYFKDGIKDIPPLTVPEQSHAVTVLKFDRRDRPVAEYGSITAAAKAHGVARSKMNDYLRGDVPADCPFYWLIKGKHPIYLSTSGPKRKLDKRVKNSLES